MDKFYYKNIFIYSSLQFMGNVEEYFSKYSEKMVAFVVMPRTQPNDSLIRLYEKGKLIEEKKVKFFSNIFLYYLLWYIYQLYFLIKYFSFKERIAMITFHPNTLFLMSLQKIIRRVDFVYWIADYFPPINKFYVIYEKFKKYYNSKIKFVCYLSDKINEIMNGRIIDNQNRKTIMWGIKPKIIKRDPDKQKKTMLIVSVIRKSQGLEYVFDFLKTHKEYSVKIIGAGEKWLYDEYRKIILENKIASQVYFPNKFFSDRELEEISKTCRVGIALYDIDKNNATYYTDPGKVKTYHSLGLPVIMTDVSAVSPYVKKFGSGKVIKRSGEELDKAFADINGNYQKYLRGVNNFNEYFNYETYYKKAFEFLE